MKMSQRSERGVDCEGHLVCTLRKLLHLFQQAVMVTRTRVVALVVIRG